MIYYKTLIVNSPLGEFTYSSPQKLNTLQCVTVLLNSKEKSAVIIEECEKPSFETLNVLHVEDTFYSMQQLQIAKFISSYYVCSLAQALSIFTPFNSTINKKEPLHVEDKITLSHEQSKAYEFVKSHKLSLVFGDTGSGKTEIYIKLFLDAIAQNRRALFLLPEISLTPQMFKRLEQHFGVHVVLWHSKLTKVQRTKALHKIRDGSAKIIAGARSALFLPIDDLGLIVVDEEHDDSYKASSNPRYNARDMAIYLGSKFDVKVVLGSATPSLNSYEKVPFVRLEGTYFNSDKKYIYEESIDTVTPLMLDHLHVNVKKRKQSIVFVPTRANFKYIICNSCGKSVECPYCSVGMSVHKYRNILKCHYCNYSEKVPLTCSSCGCSELQSSRVGTVEVIEQINRDIENIKVAQFDRDSITSNRKLIKTLQDFNDNKIDVLVGTQMLSKGHDYHDVSLCIVLGIDNILHVSDYRARERALSTLLQIAGRAGRSGEAEIIIQTFNKDFFSKYINNYEQFLKDEKLVRVGLYPPYKKLARLMFAHKNEKKAEDEMSQALYILRQFSDVEIVGFGASAINKIALKFRYQILLRSDKSTQLLRAISTCKTPLMQVDIDPLEFS